MSTTTAAGPPVLVGIDAGGSSTRARARRGDAVVFDGCGGPGNPGTVPAADLRAHLADALRGCPHPAVVVACVAGAGSPELQAEVAAVLRDLLPGAEVAVAPDYAAAFHAMPPEVQVCVAAGTGSVVCSADTGGDLSVSGGRGWILGDPGSAARLGQLLLERYVDEPESLDAASRRVLEHTLEVRSWRDLVQLLHRSSAPAALMARAAPLLTALAEHGDGAATAALDTSMDRLAGTVRRHVRASAALPPDPSVGLVGGVWRSSAAVASMTRALQLQLPGAAVHDLHDVEPVDGALRLAERRAG